MLIEIDIFYIKVVVALSLVSMGLIEGLVKLFSAVHVVLQAGSTGYMANVVTYHLEYIGGKGYEIAITL